MSLSNIQRVSGKDKVVLEEKKELSNNVYTAFGATVQELDVSDAVVNRDKTKFSMYIPEVAKALKERNTKSVILVGIEVS